MENKIKTFYDRHFASEEYAAYRPRSAYKPYIDVLSPSAEDSILDIGCGTGHLLKHAEEQGASSYGVDISEESVRLCRDYIDGTVKQSAAEELPFDAAMFDLVTCIGVLEHSPTPDEFLAEAQRVARPDAQFLFVVPNKKFLFWQLTDEGTEQQEIHEELRTLSEWRDLFDRAGFTINDIRKDFWHLKYSGVKQQVGRILNAAIPLRYNYQFVFRMEADQDG